ncbi:glycosyltransferase family 39 protein, partial [Candidatus Margulisiibacteriota bacterium]
LTLVFRNKAVSILERLGLSFGLGIGLITIIMFAVNLFNLKLSYSLVNIIIALIAVPALIWSISKRFPFLGLPKIERLRKIEYALLGLISLKIAYVFFEAIIKPVFNFDALWRHSLIAKAIFTDGTFQTPLTLTLLKTNPPFTSLAQAWIFFGLGSWNQMLGKIVFPLLFLSLILVFYAGLRRYYSKYHSLIFTFLLSALPFMVFHATSAYADFPQAYFYSIGTLYLFLFIKDEFKNISDLIIASLFLGLNIFVKRHGIYLAGMDGLILLIALSFNKKINLRTKANYVLALVGLILIIAAPWFYFHQPLVKEIAGNLAVPFSQAEITAETGLPPVSERLGPALKTFRDKMFFFGNWHLAWGVIVLSLIFFGRKIFKTPLVYLLAIIALNLCYTFAGLTLLDTYRFLRDGTLLNRMMLYYMPLVILFCALAMEETSIRK